MNKKNIYKHYYYCASSVVRSTNLYNKNKKTIQKLKQ